MDGTRLVSIDATGTIRSNNSSKVLPSHQVTNEKNAMFLFIVLARVCLSYGREARRDRCALARAKRDIDDNGHRHILYRDITHFSCRGSRKRTVPDE
jgi:hypothetical protein